MLDRLNKRYWLFAFMNYYPQGGLNDIKTASDSLEELKDYEKFFQNGEWNAADEYDQIEIFDSVKKRRLVLKGRK